MARIAYPTVIQQLCSQEPLEVSTRVDYVHPAARKKQTNASDKQEGTK